MGMGDVPIAKIMEKLGERGVDARKIIEAAQWWEHFKVPMLKETMEAFGSPIYSSGGGIIGIKILHYTKIIMQD